jgi:ribosomal protein S18 acetylase RimI-like enzyme
MSLAELMYDAYQDSVDYNGESLTEARGEVDALMEGRYGLWLPQCSWICAPSERLHSAVMMVEEDPSIALLAFVMTRRDVRGCHHASRLILASLSTAGSAGYPACALFVSANNSPALSLYQKLGFQRASS